MKARRLLVAMAAGFIAAGLIGSGAQATRLFAIYAGPAAVAGPTEQALAEIDAETGASAIIASVEFRIWGDLAGRTGDASGVYAVGRIPGAAFENRVSRIDVVTGAVTDLYSFTASDLGFPFGVIEFLGVAFDPFDSSVATVLGLNTFGLNFAPFVFDLHIGTGTVSGLQTLLLSGALPELTYAPDGTLYTIFDTGFLSDRSLGTIDPSTGVVTEIGPCTTPDCTLNALDFHPGGELFGIDRARDLLRISPSTAETLDLVGTTGFGIGAFHGMAFVIPEPATGALFAAGLACIAARRRRGPR